MAETFIYTVKANDNFTQAITTMRNAGQAFSKDLEGLNGWLNRLNKNKFSLQLDLDKAKTNLDEARQKFDQLGSAINRNRLEAAQAKYDNIARNLRLVSQNAEQAEKDITDLTGAIQKSENRAGSGKWWGKAGASGLPEMMANTLMGITQTQISSALGAQAGGVVNAGLSGAMNGAVMGLSSGFGLPGALIGGGIGFMSGMMDAANQQFKESEEARNTYIQQTYTSIMEKQNAQVETGSGIAASREDTKYRITQLIGKTRAEDLLDDIEEMSANTPLSYDALAGLSQTLLKNGFTEDADAEWDTMEMLSALGGAGIAKGIDLNGLNQAAEILSKMISSNKVSLDEMNRLMEMNIPVMDYLSEEFGETADVVQLLKDGLISGEEAARSIYEHMNSDFSGEMDAYGKTFNGSQAQYANAWKNIQSAAGEGYNSKIIESTQRRMDSITGENAERYKEAYEKIGAHKAEIEMLKDELELSALDIVMGIKDSDDRFNDELSTKLSILAAQYQVFGPDSEQARAALAEAQAIGTAQYNKTAGHEEFENQKEIIEDVRDLLVSDRCYWDAGYKLGQEFSKGMKAASQKGVLDANYTSIYGINTSPTLGHENRMANTSEAIQNSFALAIAIGKRPTKAAFGIDRVPRDNFPVILHQDERVLTAQQARSAGRPAAVNIAIHGLTVREQSDIDAIARALSDKLQKAWLVAAG